jgi:hypothetical protein
MSVSPLVAAHSSVQTQRAATTAAVFLDTLWNKTGIRARPSVRHIFLIFISNYFSIILVSVYCPSNVKNVMFS